jgi:hypothetical protein
VYGDNRIKLHYTTRHKYHQYLKTLKRKRYILFSDIEK